MNKNKRIEIIDIELGINISEEIRNKVDSLNNDITLYTRNLVLKEASKKKPSKKQLLKQYQQAQMNKALELLEAAYNKDKEQWIKGWELIKETGEEPTAQEVNKLSMRLRKFLKKEKKWSLLSIRKRGRTAYRLSEFSDNS